jgi:bacterioferritin-associated ferredoxin
MFICICHALTDKDLENIVKTNRCSSLSELSQHSAAGRSCGSCLVELEEALKAAASQSESDGSPGGG